jgi:hypothetical protein
VREKGEAVSEYGGEVEVREHVARYLVRVAVSHLPRGVLETLNAMSEEELEVLERLGVSFEEAGAKSTAYMFGVH